MNCPKCGDELQCSGGAHVKWKTIFGVSRSSLAQKTKLMRIWRCKGCGKYFALRMNLVEVEIVDAKTMSNP